MFHMPCLVRLSLIFFLNSTINSAIHWHTKLLKSRLELFISPKLVLRMSSIFSRDKLIIPIVLLVTIVIFWLAKTSNKPISLMTWLAVNPLKFKLTFNL